MKSKGHTVLEAVTEAGKQCVFPHHLQMDAQEGTLCFYCLLRMTGPFFPHERAAALKEGDKQGFSPTLRKSCSQGLHNHMELQTPKAKRGLSSGNRLR